MNIHQDGDLKDGRIYREAPTGDLVFGYEVESRGECLGKHRLVQDR